MNSGPIFQYQETDKFFHNSIQRYDFFYSFSLYFSGRWSTWSSTCRGLPPTAMRQAWQPRTLPSFGRPTCCAPKTLTWEELLPCRCVCSALLPTLCRLLTANVSDSTNFMYSIPVVKCSKVERVDPHECSFQVKKFMKQIVNKYIYSRITYLKVGSEKKSLCYVSYFKPHLESNACKEVTDSIVICATVKYI